MLRADGGSNGVKHMKKLMLAGAAALALTGYAGAAAATTYTEDFEAAFPAWESGWFGVNSNAETCYGAGQGRGNNPDGLWISTTGQGCNSSPVAVVFNSAFASSLTSFAMDVAGATPTTLTFFDKDGAILQAFNVVLTNGWGSDPGVYSHYGVTSNNGIKGFSFSGAAAGNTSIDNLVAVTNEGGGNAVPEPATWALMIGGFGLAGAALRRRRALVA